MVKVAMLLVLTGVLMVGCKPKPQAVTDNNIQFDSIQVEKTYYLLEDKNNPNCDFQLKYVYPVAFGNEEVLKAVQKQFLRSYFGDEYENFTPQEAVNLYTEQYIEDYKSLETDYKAEKEHEHEVDPGAWYSYVEYTVNEIKFNKSNLLSYAISYENYTGGAHGSHTYINYNIDLATGELLTESEIFIDGFQDEMAQILVDKLVEQNDVKSPEELESIGFFSIDEIYPNDNFSIDETGITYFFNEYEIAAYVVGTTHIHLLYDDIKHLIRQGSPIRVLFES
ncbi:hypothetical protein AGMMS49574_20760 [Bacteroidia bacterium]|nr:hypothetical protein AGMMS49574_20760 [Bacteroidia bacterium]